MNLKKLITATILLMTIVSCYSEERSNNNINGRLKLAMAQMLVDGGDVNANLKRAIQRINTAAENGADLILLPEAMDLGWTHSAAGRLAESVPRGSVFKKLAKSAIKNSIYVCAGIIEKDGHRTFNSAVLISPEGKLLLKHRKINELNIAHDIYDQGDRINVCETEFGTLGVLICADAMAKDYMLTRSMGYLGADLILLPCSWAVPLDFNNEKTPYGGNWKKAFSEVSQEFNLNIAAVSNVGKIIDGPWKNWSCIGNSMFVGNNAGEIKILPHGDKADTIVYQDIVLLKRPARGTSWPTYWKSKIK